MISCMRTLALIVLTLSLQACASHDPWTKQDTTLQWITTGLYVADALQTKEIQYRDDLEEGGWSKNFIGRQPSTSDTWQYFGSMAITSYIISYYLPARWRPFWQGAQIASETFFILGNCGHGLGKVCHEGDHR